MDKETKSYIKQLGQELALYSHQSKDKELSDLVADSNKKIEALSLKFDNKLTGIEEAITNFEKKNVIYDLTAKIVFGFVIMTLTAVVGALIALVII